MKRERFNINLIYFISMLMIVGVRILFALKVFKGFGNFEIDYIFTILVQIIALGIIPITLYLIFLKRNKIKKPFIQMLDNFGYKKRVSGRNWVKIIIISLLSPFVVMCISSIWQTLLYYIGYNSGVSSSGGITNISFLLLELLFTATLPAIFEEFINRGVLYSGYKKRNSKKVIFITAIMFALMHQNITQVGYTFVCGLIAGGLVYYTKSIYPAILYHFSNNAISVFRQFGRGTGNWLNYINKFYSYVLGDTVGVIIGNILFFIICIVIYFLIISLTEKPKKICAHKVYDTYIYAPKDADLSCYENVKPIKITLYDNIFLYATIVMNTAITIFTLVFGILQ